MRRLRLLALLVLPLLVLSACNGDDDDNELGLREGGELIVGSNIAYAPFESLEGGDPVGFDIDLMTEVAERLELEVRFVNNPSFDALIPSLQDGQYDAIISAMTITAERAEEIAFSDPYFEADQSLIVNASETPDLRASTDLGADDVIGVERGTTGQFYAEENFGDVVAEVRIFEDTPSALSDLEAGRIQAALIDFPVAAFAAETEFEGVLEVVERFTTDEQYGIGVAQDNQELLDAINEALAEMRADGTYDEIFEKWFGTAP